MTDDISKEELMIDERKQRERQEAKPGEVVQAIFYAFMNGREKLVAAKVLFENDCKNEAINSLVLALEELGKIPKFGNLLSNWKDPDRFDQYKSTEPIHEIKLESFLRIFGKLAIDGKLSLTLNGLVSEITKGKDIIELFIKSTDSKSAEKYHNLRLSLLYSKFDGKIASSPYHFHKSVEFEFCQHLTDFSLAALDKLYKKLKKIISIYTDILEKLYTETDHQRIVDLKKELNRRVRRTLPAFRFYSNSLLDTKYGVSIKEWCDHPDREKMTDIWQELPIEQHIEQLFNLIKSHEKIEDFYYYPPLKDEAKNYYQSLKTQRTTNDPRI